MSERRLKTVFTLKSGKSIVIHIYEKECFDIYDQWINYNITAKVKTDPNKVNISKAKNGVVYEKIGILLEEVAAIQIGDAAYGD